MAKKSTRSVKKKASGKSSLKKQLYVRLPGTKRHYKNTRTGKIYTRAQYEKIRKPTPIHKKLGKKKAAKRIKTNRAAQARYERLVQDYIRHKRRDNLTVTKRGVRNSQHFKQIIRDLKSNDPDRKAQALFESGRIRKSEIAEYVDKFEKEGGGVKLELKWKVVSKKNGATAFTGTYRECVRWLAFGTRRQRFKLESEVVEDHEDET